MVMTAYNETWKNAILKVLERHYLQWVLLQTIYKEIDLYRPLNDYEKQPWKEGKSQLRYENKIRTVLTDMAEEGLVERMDGDRGMWKRKYV